MRTLTVLLALLVTPATAQELTPLEADTLPRLIDRACIDIHPSTGCEQIVLLESLEPETADLIILTDRRSDPASDPVLIARSLVFNGGMWGMSPTLEDAGGGQLRVLSEQMGIGRHPWFQGLDIGWRGDGVVLLGFSYSTYDRFTASSFNCEVDYEAGHYRTEIALNDPETEGADETIEAASGATDPEPIPITDWHAFAPMPEVCTRAWNRYFDLLP